MKSLIEQGKLLILSFWRHAEKKGTYLPARLLPLGCFLCCSASSLLRSLARMKTSSGSRSSLSRASLTLPKRFYAVRFDVVQDGQYFFVDFRLQLLCERLVQPGEFGPEDPGPLQFVAGVHDPRKRKIHAIQNAINLGFLGALRAAIAPPCALCAQ
jgi:hypothetical protein